MQILEERKKKNRCYGRAMARERSLIRERSSKEKSIFLDIFSEKYISDLCSTYFKIAQSLSLKYQKVYLSNIVLPLTINSRQTVEFLGNLVKYLKDSQFSFKGCNVLKNLWNSIKLEKC